MVADPDVALFDLADITPQEICVPYLTGSFARADDDPKVDSEIFGKGFAIAGDDYDYDYYSEDEIFGETFGGGDDCDKYSEDDILDYLDCIFGGKDATGEDDEIHGDDYAADDIFG